MTPAYEYKARRLTDERRREIARVIYGLGADAVFDIEDKREIYEALVDLFQAAVVDTVTR
jgi:hypothetical protein